MADNKPVKISQLPPSFGIGINDSDLIASSRVTGSNKLETQKVSIGELRKLMDFGNAFNSINEAITGSLDGQQFYVFVDDSKEFVYRYMNMGGIPSPVLDSSGEPIKEPTTALIKRLASLLDSEGFGLIGSVLKFSDLENIKPTKVGRTVRLVGYYDGSTVGGGLFVSKSGNLPSDGGVVVNTGNGLYWERVTDGLAGISLDLYGVKYGEDISIKVQSAVNAAKRLQLTDVIIPTTPYDQSFTMSSRVDIDFSDGNVIFIRGAGSNKLSTTINQRFDGVLFYFHRTHNSDKYFWTTGGIENLTVTLDPIFATSTGTVAIQVSDTWGFIINRVRIINFKGGVGVNLKNETAWTEGTKIKDLDIRATQIGILCNRDLNKSGNTSSFFGTQIDQYSFQAGTGKAGCAGIQVGDNDTAVAPTVKGECILYGSEITMRYWAEGGGNNYGIFVKDQGFVTSGTTLIIPDGVGLDAENVNTAAPLRTIGVSKGGVYHNRTIVEPYQGKVNCLKLRDLPIVLESVIYFDKGAGSNTGLYKGRPMIDPKGLTVYAYQEFTKEERIAGFSAGLFNLPVGCRMRVTLRYHDLDDPSNARISSYIVSVGGAGMFTTVAPENPDYLNGLTTTNSTVSGTSVLTSATLDASRARLNDFVDTATSPRVVNGNTAQVNKDGFGTDTRNIKVVMPPNASANKTLAVGFEMEFI